MEFFQRKLLTDAATVNYILVNIVVVFGMRNLERKVRVPGFIGAAPSAPQAGH